MRLYAFLALAALSVASQAQAQAVLTRNYDGSYTAAPLTTVEHHHSYGSDVQTPPWDRAPSFGYGSDVRTSAPVYDRRGDRVGTIRSDASGTHFYDNRDSRH